MHISARLGFGLASSSQESQHPPWKIPRWEDDWPNLPGDDFYCSSTGFVILLCANFLRLRCHPPRFTMLIIQRSLFSSLLLRFSSVPGLHPFVFIPKEGNASIYGRLPRWKKKLGEARGIMSSGLFNVSWCVVTSIEASVNDKTCMHSAFNVARWQSLGFPLYSSIFFFFIRFLI